MSKSDEAYEILRKGVMDGTFAPGHRLVVDQLVRDYGISSVPWRESLRRLEAEGWVDIVRNAGAVVKTFDTNAWERTMQLLARIEGYATAVSAPHLTPEDLEKARALNKEMAGALASFDPGRFGALNREFHQLLYSRCDDDRLRDLVDAEWTRLELIRRSAFWYAPGRAQASIAEHEGLVDLVEGGAAPDVIETAARRHELNTVAAIAEAEAEAEERGGAAR
ncbi:GntR family transcriptional regulator [Myceligenerans indicum]|uniref:GntR family transcriptional regulator n=1 Tax=Myceligenerans indicum TaxID=2593663 RepID=A0ABS1LQI8_9MICO|nr:GntR family transcriptional regulator [Myceligenerans indicum]MBL0888334.1 GntR family transcriptional regulator [Myceligenerans indicum]